MNTPDAFPQMFAAPWLAQFSDPNAWQAWMKMPDGFGAGSASGMGAPGAAAPGAAAAMNAANPAAMMTRMLGDFNASVSPAKLEALRDDYLQKAARLWQDFATGKTPAFQDKRFAAPEWTANPMSAFSVASYLLNAAFLTALAEAVEAKPRDKHKIRFAVQQMVDALSPANFLATNPEAQQQMIETKGESLGKGMANMLADLQKGRISQSDESAFEVGRNVGVTPGTVVFENDLFQLIQYAPSTPAVHEVPLLMIPPCINKYYILDLQPENSLVRYLVEQGNTVFMMSWRNPDQAMSKLGLDDYVERGAIRAIEAARAISGQEKVNVFGFCVGGTIAASALAVEAARGNQPAASLSLFTTLLDFSDNGVLDVFVDEAQVALREQKMARGGLMPGRDLATMFSSLRPNDLVWNYVQQNYLKGKNPPAFDLLYWNADSTNLPGPMVCWYLRNTYLENKLKVPGALTVAGVPVDLGAIDCPTFLYGSREDHIVPWDAAFLSMQLLNPNKPKANRFVLGASGHIAGVINPASKNKRSYWVADGAAGGDGKGRGKPSPSDWLAGATERKGSWWPEWAAFLAEQGGQDVPAPDAPGGVGYQAIEPAPGRYVKARAD
ncbi:class I poly(R)-hydroxyalkanoic acid synthase [Massilia forsythiae]|uniref:Class I poly(R)-hydroxyalkanoic acid synthase n=1 Tax=Massilia forsythiae TaxID=2728020 RepID=A0A7Z2ZUP8_9BURK|nr:class I poly(R)-hydroxyalkanoic acid synthase [Massilia forsythiae]QJE02634.1 class I poly(R)-hydroxyalkanoic acid synthase [Massilia forsythiae]